MKGKYLVILNGIGSLIGIINCINSNTQYEMIGWGCSAIFALSSMITQNDLNKCRERDLDI